MENKKYAGVWFMDTWEVVPRRWIFTDTRGTKCFWPSTGDVKELAKSDCPPLRRQWPIYKIEEIAVYGGDILLSFS